MAKSSRSEGPDESPVRLKPILGISPTGYLPVSYGLALLLLLFFLLIYPGIRRHGTDITFRSRPAGAEVILDGVRLGATPVTAFVESGERELLLRYPGFSSEELTIAVEGRLIGSLLFPQRKVIRTDLAPRAALELATERAEAFATWALTGGGSAAFPIPPILGETGRALGAYPEDPGSQVAGEFLLENGKLQVSSPSQLKDLSRGIVLFHGLGGPSPLGISRGVLELIQAAKDSHSSHGLASVLSRGLPSELFVSLEAGPWYGEHGAANPVVDRLESSRIPIMETELPRALTLEGMRFRRGDERFLMLIGEVTRAQYAAFLTDVPAWEPQNRVSLVEAGSVTEDYLADWGSPRSGEEPIRFVSWFAAEAFAQWLDSRLAVVYPELSEDWEVRLPRGEEWESVAARENPPGSDAPAPARITFESEGESPLPRSPGRRSDAGFYDIYGNLWEWSDDWYTTAPGAQRFVTLSPGEIVGAERVVQGGSFANGRRELSENLRGSQPPSWCSPYLGFRLVIAVREESL